METILNNRKKMTGINSFYLNIGLNVGESEPSNQYKKTSIFMRGVLNVLNKKHKVISSQQKLYKSSYQGMSERTIAVKIVLKTHALSNISEMLPMLQQGCKKLKQECIALKAGESGALVYTDRIDTLNFDNQYFKQF